MQTDVDDKLTFIFEGEMTLEQLAIYIVSHRAHNLTIISNGNEQDMVCKVVFYDVENNADVLVDKVMSTLESVWTSLFQDMTSEPASA